METVAVFGSTSGIARAVVGELISQGYNVVLCARSSEALERQARDIKVKHGKQIETITWDVLDFGRHREKVKHLVENHHITGAVIAVGVMPSQEDSEQNYGLIQEVFQTNLTGPVILMTALAHYFQKKRSGFICCISSVAGDRGRQSNAIYGSSKGGLSTYLQGLRNKLAPYHVLVQTVKPGQVRTPMTAHMKDSPLFADPERVAKDIVKGLEKKREVVYSPFYWRVIMGIIRIIPEFLFKRMKL
ncbi:SDR family oxidoreductase [Fibrobacterota bacterium]